MRFHPPALLTLALGAAACSSPDVAPPSQVFFPTKKPMSLIEGPSVPPPANDIPESQRVAWFDAHRPPKPPPPPHVERVYVSEPVYHAHDHHGWDDWYLPISLSLGYWSGWGGHHGHDDHHDHGHDHGGSWAWGVTYNSQWWH
jgi:hypothetical protein